MRNFFSVQHESLYTVSAVTGAQNSDVPSVSFISLLSGKNRPMRI